MRSDQEHYSGKYHPVVEVFRPTLNHGERFIRILLMTGFMIVLAVEAWLLVQAIQLWL